MGLSGTMAESIDIVALRTVKKSRGIDLMGIINPRGDSESVLTV